MRLPLSRSRQRHGHAVLRRAGVRGSTVLPRALPDCLRRPRPAMKFYYHDPDAALSGMAELNLEQRGAYYSILDLLYSRDGIVPDDDLAVARMIRVHWRTWRALKKQLMAAGKIRVNFGLLEANGVSEELLRVSRLSQDQRRRASGRWQDYKKAKEINGAPYATAGNATY